mmetsp:Transcript_42631/g.71059  ORF Transcript_42631/g.71059 Transcript_42631/m.71059 type:complete len:129 (+) Transcript_42631:329-715(+)
MTRTRKPKIEARYRVEDLGSLFSVLNAKGILFRPRLVRLDAGWKTDFRIVGIHDGVGKYIVPIAFQEESKAGNVRLTVVERRHTTVVYDIVMHRHVPALIISAYALLCGIVHPIVMPVQSRALPTTSV